MNSSFYLWLVEVEETLWRMIRGVYRFTFQRLPQWVRARCVETVGPAAVQLIRVLAVLFLWLAVVFVPAICLGKIGGRVMGNLRRRGLAGAHRRRVGVGPSPPREEVPARGHRNGRRPPQPPQVVAGPGYLNRPLG